MPFSIFLIIVLNGVIENTAISSLSGETRNSVGLARLAEPIRLVSGPD